MVRMLNFLGASAYFDTTMCNVNFNAITLSKMALKVNDSV